MSLLTVCVLAVASGAAAPWTKSVPRIAWVAGYDAVKPCHGKEVPKELWFDEETAKRYQDRISAELKAIGYEKKEPYRSGHSFRPWTKKLWNTHRDYFGQLPNGQRGLTYPGLPDWLPGLSKVCVANEAVVDERIAEWKRDGCPGLLIAGEDDGDMGYCRCAKCRALDADAPGEMFLACKSDRYINFWNRICAKARVLNPDVKVCVFLYSATRRPPRRERVAYPENMIFSYVPTLHDEDPTADIRGWQTAGAKYFYNRPNYLCIRSALPSGLEKYVRDVHAQMRAIGSTGDFFDRDAGLPAQQFVDFSALMVCVDPDITFDEIESRWCARFGAAAETVRRYYANIRARCDREWPKLRQFLRDNDIEFLDDSHFSRVVHRLHTFAELKADQAILEAFDDSVLKGVERERFEQLKCLANQAVLVMRMFAHDTPENRKAVLDYRVAHKDELGYGWMRLYTKGEFWIWDATPGKIFYENSPIKRYADRLENSMTRPEGPIGPDDPESARIHLLLKSLREDPQPVRVILDTDMLTDFDDVGALACLHALADAGECEILATVSCTRGNASVGAIEVINSYYGRPDIPVGCAKSIGVLGASAGAKVKVDSKAFPDKEKDGAHYKYRKLLADYPDWCVHADSDDAPDANDVYRRALAASPDHSVVICSIGFLTNLRRLLETKGDRHSPLDGKALVAKKVKKWVAMACNYPNGNEYNSKWDPESSRIVLNDWPTPVVFSDFQYGGDLFAGRAIAEMTCARNPVKDVFAGNIPSREEIRWDAAKWGLRHYGMGGRAAWDETAVLAAVRGEESYFNVHRGRYRMVGSEGDDEWVPDEENGPHLRITEKLNKRKVSNIIDELICRPPKGAVR